MKRIVIADAAGHTWQSDPDVDGELTEEAEADIISALKGFADVNHLSLSIEGVMHYFNPANIVAVWIEETP